MKLFIVQVELVEGGQEQLPYDSIVECLNDHALRGLFDADIIKQSSIHLNSNSKGSQGSRITARQITTWETFAQQLISNSPTILRQLL